MREAHITPARYPLRGTASLPGDKSISHRRALLSLLVDSPVRLINYGSGEDCGTTLDCLRRLGKQVTHSGTEVYLEGSADCRSGELYCGNSGTTARLLMGLLAARAGEWTITGDASLSRRPMERVAEPLRTMGADLELTNGCLPVRIRGQALHGIQYQSPVASAQVKSAVLFAAMQATGVTRYHEPFASRDHTEKLLGLANTPSGDILLDPSSLELRAESLSGMIPGDPSAAAYWIAAALLVPESQIVLPGMLMNPTRTAFLNLLRQSGADCSIRNQSEQSGEETATVTVSAGNRLLSGFTVDSALSAAVIDEIPVLALLAARTNGGAEFRGVGELRVKESDRLQRTVDGLRAMGVEVQTQHHDFRVDGPAHLHGAILDSGGDHRMAMTFGIAGLIAAGETVVRDAGCVAISYPDFWNELLGLAPDSIQLRTAHA